MHSYKHYIFYFFLLILVYGTSRPEAITSTAADQAPSLSLELEMAQTMCLNQNERLRDDLLAIINFTDEHLTYWQETQHNPYSYFFSKGPLKVLWGKGQTEEIEDHITKLQRSQSWACYHLGEVYRLSNALKSAQSDAKLKPLLYQAINSAKDYLQNTKTKVSAEQTITIEELTNLLQKNIKKLSSAKKGLMGALSEHQKPGHITRNWVAYTGAAVFAAITAKYFYDNPGKPAEWYEKIGSGSKKFFEDHIKQPGYDIYNLIFNNQSEMSGQVQKLEPISDPQEKLMITEVLQKQSRKYLTTYHAEHYSNYELLDEEIKKTIDATSSVYLEDLNINLKTRPLAVNYSGEVSRESLIQLAKNSFWNNDKKAAGKDLAEILDVHFGVDPQCGDLLTILFLQYKLKGAKLLLAVQSYDPIIKAILSDTSKLFQANRLNFALLMTIPAALVLYGTYKTATNIAYWFVPKYTFHIPVKNYLRLIGQLLNRFNSPHFIMGPEQDGYLLYWIHKLKGYVTYMPYSIRKHFMEDIEELELLDLQIHQKLEIWNRMYKTYEFLMPHQANPGYPLI